MQQLEDVRVEVRAFILDNFLPDERPGSLADATELLTTGIVSSLGMLEIVAFLEDKYSIALRQEDLSPERLNSVDLIVSLVEELSGTKMVNE